jgi:hypothetical protein
MPLVRGGVLDPYLVVHAGFPIAGPPMAVAPAMPDLGVAALPPMAVAPMLDLGLAAIPQFAAAPASEPQQPQPVPVWEDWADDVMDVLVAAEGEPPKKRRRLRWKRPASDYLY